MKKVKFVALALAAATMFSCSKENNVEAPIPAGQKATLKLAVKGNGSPIKAIGTTTGDAVVNNLTVFAFRADGLLDVAPIYIASPAGHIVSGTDARDSISVTTAVDSIFVVANAGPLATSSVAGVSNKASLYAKIGSLMNGAATTQTAANLWMEGKGKVVWDAGSTTTGSTSVALNFVGAKIEFSVDLTAFTNPAGADYINVQDVVLLYAGQSGKFFETAANKAAQTTFFSGDIAYGPGYTTPTPTVATPLVQTVAFDGTGAMTTTNPHFYTFANNGVNMPTILALRGTRTEGGTPKTYYWPIQFNAADAGVTIEAGKSYTVNLKLKGSTDGGGTGGGGEDPEVVIAPANVEVIVTPATWIVVPTINKEFN